jgi:hypothetical protein
VGDVIEGTLIESNSAAVGGGVYAADAAAVFVADSTIARNVALVYSLVARTIPMA